MYFVLAVAILATIVAVSLLAVYLVRSWYKRVLYFMPPVVIVCVNATLLCCFKIETERPLTAGCLTF